MNNRQRLYIQEPYYRIGFCRIETFPNLKTLQIKRPEFIQFVGNRTRDFPGTRTWTQKELRIANL